MIGEYTSWFENLDIYQEWMKNLPEPFNNAAFASAVFLGVVIFLLTVAADRILLIRWNARQRKARRRTEERRRQEMEERRERERRSREDREQMELYLRFLMTAQMQNFTSLQGITFGQWKSQMFAEQAAGGAGWMAGNTGGETGIGERAGKGTEDGINAEGKNEAEIGAEEIRDEINIGEDSSTKWEISVEMAAPDFPGAPACPEECGVEPADAETGRNEPMERMEEEKPELGFMSEESGNISIFGELGLPVKRVPDGTVAGAAEQKVLSGSLRSVDMEAVMEQIRRDKDPGAAEGLSFEQQSDFAKVLAQMQEDERQQDYLERFQREKSEIIRNNLSVLDQSIYIYGENPETGKGAEKTVGADEEMERRKAAAREAIRRAEQLGQEKGKKKKLFGRRK